MNKLKSISLRKMLNVTQIDWLSLSKYQTLSDEFISEFIDFLDIESICTYQKLSEIFIEKHKDKVDWTLISKYQKLSEPFIEQYIDEVDWPEISANQILSESFLEKHQDKIDWNYVSKFQQLSEPFIERHKDKVYWDMICKYQKLSKEFIGKYELSLNLLENSWMYKDREYKRKEIAKTRLYEIIDDHVYAYKAVRQDYYSINNFQYYYEIGKEYTAHANHNIDEDNSFGLSAWTCTEAKYDYDRGKILKVKVHLDDVACLVKNGTKLRCTKIEILEEM